MRLVVRLALVAVAAAAVVLIVRSRRAVEVWHFADD